MTTLDEKNLKSKRVVRGGDDAVNCFFVKQHSGVEGPTARIWEEPQPAPEYRMSERGWYIFLDLREQRRERERKKR